MRDGKKWQRGNVVKNHVGTMQIDMNRDYGENRYYEKIIFEWPKYRSK